MTRRSNYWALKLSATPIMATPPQVVEAQPPPPPKEKRPPAKGNEKRALPLGHRSHMANGQPKPNIAGYETVEGYTSKPGKRPRKRDKKLPDTEAQVLGIPDEEEGTLLSHGRTTYRVGGNEPGCTVLVTERMVLLVSSGISQVVACAAMGLPLRTVREWNDKGKRDVAEGVTSPYSHWWSSMLEAKAACEANWVARLNEGAVMDWRAAAFMLERRFGVRWAPKAPKDKLPEAADVAGKSAEELKAMLADLTRKALSSGDGPTSMRPPENQKERMTPLDHFGGPDNE